MPYIAKTDRIFYEPELSKLKFKIDKDTKKGELTYLIYSIAIGYLNRKEESYENISNTISSLIDAAEELRRRRLNPYEDKKLTQNEDI